MLSQQNEAKETMALNVQLGLTQIPLKTNPKVKMQ